MLNMNCRGCRQRFLPLPDLSRKIEGDSVRRVDRKAPEANRFNSFLRILEMQFHRKKKGKNKQKSYKSLFESLSKNTWKYVELKNLDQLRKKTRVFSSWSRSHSPIDKHAQENIFPNQNTKNLSCVCARCALWYESVRLMDTSTCQRLVNDGNLN